MEERQGDQMKSLSVRLGMILIGLSLFTRAQAWSGDWKCHGADEWYYCFYDTQSLTLPSKKIVRVSIEKILTHPDMI